MNSIEIKSLTKRYGKFKAVDNLSFEIKQGDFAGFLGVNGAGKSTTVNMLSTILAPDDGEAYICGVAGERFCVRNSGAEAVVEGIGDHGCEYMTGGCAVILGETGKNFAAGMSGGVAYVLDERHSLYLKLNKALVTMTGVESKYDKERLRSLIERHVKETGSKRGKDILEHWEEKLLLFKKIIPNDYSRMLTAISHLEETGVPREQAELEAFYRVQKGEA